MFEMIENFLCQLFFEREFSIYSLASFLVDILRNGTPIHFRCQGYFLFAVRNCDKIAGYTSLLCGYDELKRVEMRPDKTRRDWLEYSMHDL